MIKLIAPLLMIGNIIASSSDGPANWLEGWLMPDPGLFLWTLVTFFIVLFILKAKAWGPLMNALDDRERRINEALTSADKAKQEAEKVSGEYDEMIKKAQVKAQGIVAEGKKAGEKLREDIENKAKEKANELIKKTGVNIGTQNNIQNNIKILAYNKTDLSHLKDKHYMSFLNHSNFCVPYMIKKLHFDPKKPENHNIYISNMKNSYVMIWDGSKWNIKDRTELIDDMIEDNTNILEDKIEDWIDKGKKYPLIMKKFNRYLEKREKDAVLNKIKQEIKFILFNNRGIILKSEE